MRQTLGVQFIAHRFTSPHHDSENIIVENPPSVKHVIMNGCISRSGRTVILRSGATKNLPPRGGGDPSLRSG